MKKYAGYMIAGTIGFLLAIPATSFGAQIQSMVGKKIQAEYNVQVNGKVLDVKSIATGGTSYSPNRAIADALGLDVKLENKTVVFTEKVDNMTPTAIEQPSQHNIGDTEPVDKLAEINKKIRVAQGNVDTMNSFIRHQTAAATDEQATSESREKAQKTLDEYLSMLDGYQKELADLEAQKATLESQPTPTP